MLKKITRLQNVGLFHNGTPQPVDLAKLSLIYGANGRGKSTLVTALRSCSVNNPHLVMRRKTIDQNENPSVELIFQDANVTFQGSGWSSGRTEFLIFDNDFIEENAFTGQEITTDNRRGLYAFALGEAVEIQKRMDEVATNANDASRLRGEKEKALGTHSKPFSVKEFIAISKSPEDLKTLDELNKQLAAATSIQSIQKREALVMLKELVPDLNNLFHIFRKTIEGVQNDVEKMIKEHIRSHKPADFEGWLSDGSRYSAGGLCPYCGQATEGVELVKAYKSYFSAAYTTLKEEVQEIQKKTVPQISAAANLWPGIIDANRNRVAAWADQVDTGSPEFDLAGATTHLNEFVRLLTEIAARKNNQPLETSGTPEEEGSANQYVGTINQQIRDYNDAATKLNADFTERKQRLGQVDIAKVRQIIEQQQAKIRRHSPDVMELVDEYKQVSANAERLADEKKRVRETHDACMKDILDKYQNDVNEYLLIFGAGFTVTELRGKHSAGQAPRTDYAIKLRGKNVDELEHSRRPTEPSIPCTLSEGDKRTLALAFFLARLKTDPQKASRILIFDDPVTSLDENRRNSTANKMLALMQECEQLITLSHDPYFLRQLSNESRKIGLVPKIFRIGYAADDYSRLEDCDLDGICRSDYEIHYRRISDCLAGSGDSDIRAVAAALRPAVEGFYKRRYPKDIGPQETLGKIIENVRTSQVGNPLSHLKVIAENLDAFNRYASRFHHDSNTDRQTETIIESELRAYAEKALNLIHADGQPTPTP